MRATRPIRESAVGLLKKSLELGLGAMLLTKEAAEELLDDLGHDGSAEEPETRQVVAEIVERGQQLRAELAESIRNEIDSALQRAGLARRSELAALEQRIVLLEARLNDSGAVSASDL